MFKKVRIDILYNGEIVYRSDGKTLLGIMLHIAAILVTYDTIDIKITRTLKFTK